MSTPNPLPSAGIAEVDRIILLAADAGFSFPVGVQRWQLFAWAAESLELQRNDPTAFTRGGFKDVTRRHFPTTNR